MDFKTLTNDQAAIVKRFETIIKEFKSLRPNVREANYFERCLQQVVELQVQFDKNNDAILALPNKDTDSVYFKTNYYEETSKVFEDHKKKLQEYISLAKQPSNKVTATENTDDNKNLELPRLNVKDLEFDASEDSIQVEALLKKQNIRIKFLNMHLENIENKVSDIQTTSACNLKIKGLDEHWKELSDRNKDLFEYFEEAQKQGYNFDDIFELELRVQQALEQLYARSKNLQPTSTMNDNTVNETRHAYQSNEFKLPKVSLLEFRGDYTKWPQFRDLFEKFVLSQDISDVQKMYYLLSYVKGDAANLLSHLSTTDNDFSIAWSILKDRYENKRLLASNIFDKLFNQPTTQADSAASIRHMHDITKECLMGLTKLNVESASSDMIIMHHLLRKLDQTTKHQFETKHGSPKEFPTTKELISFLELKFQTLETSTKFARNVQPSTTKPYQERRHAFVTSTPSGIHCYACSKEHKIFSCPKFLAWSVSQRSEFTKKNNLCFNCLSAGHNAGSCHGGRCSYCSAKHNSLLHISKPQQFQRAGNDSKKTIRNNNQQQRKVTAVQTKSETSQVSEPSTSQGVSTNAASCYSATCETEVPVTSRVILSTAVVHVLDARGKEVDCRALLDPGSQVHLVRKGFLDKLGLKTTTVSTDLEGVGEVLQKINKRVNLTIISKVTDFKVQLNACVLPKITSNQPASCIEIKRWKIPNNIKLADPKFYLPQKVDLLIGMELFYNLLSIGQIKLASHLPTLQNTLLGWVVGGAFTEEIEPSAFCGIIGQQDNLEERVEKFWKMEEAATPTKRLTEEEKFCEKFFMKTTKIQNNKINVQLPFKTDPAVLGNSRDMAVSRMLSNERKFNKQPELKEAYVKFMKEYKDLGHMSEIDESLLKKPCFLPHHAVFHPTTKKIRIVFDASAKTSTNITLNDILAKGKMPQDELFTILLRFLFPKFVFTFDIEKMFRQIEVAEKDRHMQVIVWRENTSERIKVFQLNTITYGTTSAPYISTKALEYVADINSHKYPLGAKAIKRDCYMDDGMSGSNDLKEALQTQQEVIKLLSTYGFKLHKWCANHKDLLQHIKAEDRAVQLEVFDEKDNFVGTLGLIWQPQEDEFRIRVKPSQETKVTKRIVLSEIAQLFDPMGFVNPVVVLAKMFLQNLWRLNLDWDAAVPLESHTFWVTFRSKLPMLANIRISRHAFYKKLPKDIQIHAFADASERAYGAVLYARAVYNDETISTHILCSKSRVAPKKPQTLPKLELAAAKLAAELTNRVSHDVNISKENCYYWTDSEIVLAWINAEPAQFQTFVANRINSVQELTSIKRWRHVVSKENPADIVSRGMFPEELISSSLWFKGPAFLQKGESQWPPLYIKKEAAAERKRAKVLIAGSVVNNNFISKIEHKNSMRFLRRVVAWVLRFISNCRNTKGKQGALQAKEISDAEIVIIKQLQTECFPDDLKELNQRQRVNINSSLISFCPILDSKGVIRVGGRIQASDLPYSSIHQILLPAQHTITRLIIEDIHKSNHHCAPQALLAITRQRFWPISGRRIVRSIVNKCVKCVRAKPKLLQQIMGNLPDHRVQRVRAFQNCGVDFFGPVDIHYKLRGKRPTKAYISVFVCFTTKATHLEVVSDLTTEAFIGALRRFTSRRGKFRHIYCDNATNFVGTRNKIKYLEELQDLKEFRESIYDDNSQNQIQRFCSEQHMDFHFIPPRSPHFGGLWEAAVKSAKLLLQPKFKGSTLTYEELETVIIEIEAILNSRPLTPLSSDPNDLEALTPGHFLIGEPTTTIADDNVQDANKGLLHRWKQVTQIKEQFWKRWSSEYLQELQIRNKWRNGQENLEPGTMVLIKEDNLPPAAWKLGRVVSAIKGKDNKVRVAEVKTATGNFKRAVHKLAPLPVEINEDEKQHEGEGSSSNYGNNSGASNMPTSTKRSARTASKMKLTVTSLLLLYSMFTTAASQFIVKPFKTTPGLYFENLGNTHLISNEWNLVVYYNTSALWQDFSTMKEGIETIAKLCDNNSQGSACGNVINQLTEAMSDIGDKNNLIFHQTQTKVRAKRGAINIVGNVANALFGVLDSSYAESMAGTIQELKNNDQHVLNLIKNQTSIIDSTVNLVQQSTKSTNENLSKMWTFLKETITTIKRLNKEHREQKTMAAFNTITTQVMIMLHNYHRIQDTIIDVLTDTHHGRINLQLLTPRQLLQQVNIIRKHLPSELKLPVEADNILKLYQLMSVEGRVTDDEQTILFRIKVPLYAREQFELLKVIPVPFLINSTAVNIQSPTEFLIINLSRDSFYTISLIELQQCIMIDFEYICKQTHPMYGKNSKISSCIINVLNHENWGKNCMVTKVEKSSHWIALLEPNKWVYSLFENVTINVIYNDTSLGYNMNGTGIIELKPGCVIKDVGITITAHNVYASKMKTGIVPAKLITEFINTTQLFPQQYPDDPQLNFTDQIETIKRKIKALQENEQFPTNKQVHHFSIAYAALVISLVVITIAATRYLYARCRKSNQQAPTREPSFRVPSLNSIN